MVKLLFNAWWKVCDTGKQKQDRQEIIHPPQAEHNSYWADLSAASDLHNPNKVSKAFAFYSHKHIIF